MACIVNAIPNEVYILIYLSSCTQALEFSLVPRFLRRRRVDSAPPAVQEPGNEASLECVHVHVYPRYKYMYYHRDTLFHYNMQYAKEVIFPRRF